MVTFDGPNRLIICNPGTTTLDLLDVYSKWKLWVMVGTNSAFPPAFRIVGGEPLDPVAGTYIPAYLFLINGWKIKPQEADHTLTVTGAVLLTEDSSDPFAPTDGVYRINIRYIQPVNAITVEKGSTLTLEEIEASNVLAKQATLIQVLTKQLEALTKKDYLALK